MSEDLKVVHQHSSADGRRTTIVLEKGGPEALDEPLTGEDVWELEVRSRRLYIKMVVLSSIATSWVYFFGGWQVLVLVPVWALVTTFFDTPTIRSKDWVMRDLFASKDRDYEQWRRSRTLVNQSIGIFVYIAAFVPFILMIYLIVMH